MKINEISDKINELSEIASDITDCHNGKRTSEENTTKNIDDDDDDRKEGALSMLRKVSSIKTTLIIVGIIIGVVALALLGYSIFHKKKLLIDETANVIDEIKKIGEFTSICYYEELALIDSMKRTTKFTELTHSDITDELVLIAHGKIRAGFDLSKLGEDDIMVTGDTLSIRLPHAEIFDVIVNPSDYEIFVQTGKWSHEQFTAVQSRASGILKAHAEELNLIEKAEETGIKKLDTFFRTFGFSEIFFLPINQK